MKVKKLKGLPVNLNEALVINPYLKYLKEDLKGFLIITLIYLFYY